MSTVPYTSWPRSAFFTQPWSTSPAMPVASFWWDPFDELDLSLFETTMPSWIQWLNKPEWLATSPSAAPVCPSKKVLQKWRAVVDISGFTWPLKNIKVEIKPNNKLWIWGKEEVKESEENIWFKEIKKSFDMPQNVEAEKFVSWIWGNLLIVEVPIKDTTPLWSVKELLPVISTDKKQITLNVTLPPIDPAKVDIVLKDRDIIIKFWDTTIPQPQSTWTTWWSAWTYKKVWSLPENTKWNELKFVWNNNVLTITAPLWEAEQWQHKSTTVMPTMVDWTANWKQWSSTMPWSKDMKTMPWTWPMNTQQWSWPMNTQQWSCPTTKTF